MASDLQSRPYRPDPQQCCEACAFGRGEHAEWCEARVVDPGFRLFTGTEKEYLACYRKAWREALQQA